MLVCHVQVSLSYHSTCSKKRRAMLVYLDHVSYDSSIRTSSRKSSAVWCAMYKSIIIVLLLVVESGGLC